MLSVGLKTCLYKNILSLLAQIGLFYQPTFIISLSDDGTKLAFF